MRRLLLLPTMAAILLLLLSSRSNCGVGDLPIGARSLAMGGVSAALVDNPDALFLNPAGLGRMKGTGISLFYQKPFGLQDVHLGSAALTLPIKRFRIAAGTVFFGNAVYKEQRLALALSHRPHKRLLLGVAATYQSTRIEGYGSAGAFGLDFGLLYAPSPGFNLGLHVTNVNRPSLGTGDEALPRSFAFGFTTRAAPKLLLGLEVYKETGFSEEIRFGAELRPFSKLALRAGTANNPSRFSSGFGLRLHGLTLDYAFFTHNDLGTTHQFSISFHFGKKKPAPNQTSSRGRQAALPAARKEPAAEAPARLDLNTASLQQLLALKGVGAKLAKAIVEYRTRHGLFRTVEDLRKVPGVGTKKLAQLKEHVTVEAITQE